MYLPVNTRDEGNPILAILGGMPEIFFFASCYLGEPEHRRAARLQCTLFVWYVLSLMCRSIFNVLPHASVRGRQILKLYFVVCEYVSKISLCNIHMLTSLCASSGLHMLATMLMYTCKYTGACVYMYGRHTTMNQIHTL